MMTRLAVLPLWLCAAFLAHGQGDKQLRAKADALFTEERFAEALPLYSQLVSLEPGDRRLNYHYGTCVLHGGGDREKAIGFLKYAAADPSIPALAWFWLGRAYHLNYRFTDALNAYQRFRGTGDAKAIAAHPVDALRQQCRNGQQLLSSLKEITVSSKVEVEDREFFRYYDLEGIGGRIAPVPAPAPVLVPTPPAASGSQAARKRGWYDEAFAEHFASITPIDSDASAELDVAFIRKTAELGAGQTILDVGCGDGRHCFALANLGLLVTGLECSLPQLVRAAQRNEATDAGITLLQGDMRSLPRDRTYDVVTCLGTTLRYFQSDEQNRQCLQEMVEVLRAGGKLVLHMVNRDYLVAVLPCRSWWQGRGCLVLDVADMNYFTNRMRVHRTVVFEDGRQF